MKTETILYTDGSHVTVTNSYFKVDKALYHLKGITHHGFLILRPERLPALLVIVLGAILVVLSTSRIVPENFTLTLFSVELSTNAAGAAFGLSLFLVGIVAVSFMRERYAIRIATAEGEKNVIISRKKEYVKLIMDALNHAFINLVSKSEWQTSKR